MTSGLCADLPAPAMAELAQVERRAVSLDDLVSADHRVRLVWRFVEIDRAHMVEIKAVEGRLGPPAASPGLLPLHPAGART